ncbi:universal stress protein [Halovivax cerinus]|uniref:Universal stress protein n=1 Tax=Halovivax cerinus TaxID=1487865 RepID=A0ABD5NJA7_9EURY|nr:universal stress protein [Halovivax cerinus]
MFDHIVIAVDGSDEARHAAVQGLDLASLFDASVDVVHVVERSARRLARSPTEETRLRERGEGILAEVEELAADRELTVQTVQLEGAPASSLCAYAGEHGADGIVVGRQGLTGLGRRLLGGVTERILSRSDVPVFVVPDPPDGVDVADLGAPESSYDRVLVPTDGSEPAMAAARYGAAIAAEQGATLHVLNVVDIQSAGGLFDAGGLERSFVERLEVQGRETVDETNAVITDTGAEVDLVRAVERRSSFDGVAPGICEYAEGQDVDLIVMGSHGRSGVERGLLGSVASTVLRTAAVPVLVVGQDR